MYNRYIPNGAAYTRILEEDGPPSAEMRERRPSAAPSEQVQEEAPEKKSGGLASLLKGLKLDELDTGDILLLLIMLFLFLEGDDLELVITLGLMLLLSL